MKIAVADMAEDRRNQPMLGDVPLGLRDALAQSRDRHAHIGGKGLRPWPQAASRPIGVVPRLP